MLRTVTFHFDFLAREVLSHSSVSHMWSDVRLSEGSGCAILPSRTLGHNALLLMTVARIKACDVSAGVLHWWEFGSWSRARGPTGKYSQERKRKKKKSDFTATLLRFEAQTADSQKHHLVSVAVRNKRKMQIKQSVFLLLWQILQRPLSWSINLVVERINEERRGCSSIAQQGHVWHLNTS